MLRIIMPGVQRTCRAELQRLCARVSAGKSSPSHAITCQLVVFEAFVARVERFLLMSLIFAGVWFSARSRHARHSRTLLSHLVTLARKVRHGAMVAQARGHTLAVATRVTCEEAVDLDRDLVVLGNGVWATDARGQLDSRFVALAEAELRVAPGGLEVCHGATC